MTNSSSHETPFRLFTLHSQKGGVGKTSLAVGIACLESITRKAQTIIVDADLTGTSICDAFGLERGSPKQEKTSRRFLNEILLADPDECLQLLMSHRRAPKTFGALGKFILSSDDSRDDSPYLMQSNPDLGAVREMVPLLPQERHLHYFAQRLHQLVVALCRVGFRTVILDLPPGLFGLSDAAMELASDGNLAGEIEDLKGVTWDAPKSLLVTSNDKADYRAALLSAAQLLKDCRKDSGGRCCPNASSDANAWLLTPIFNRVSPRRPRGEVGPMDITDAFRDVREIASTRGLLDGIESLDYATRHATAVLPLISGKMVFRVDEIGRRLVYPAS